MSQKTNPSPEALASLPDNDDMLWEILLRLPPKPSSLPRASTVCKRWRGLVTDPKFLRCFRGYHQKPPLLGIFANQRELVFTPLLDPPDRISPECFSFGGCSGGIHKCDLMDCRHGRVLLSYRSCGEVVVCDPITSDRCRMSFPSDFSSFINGAVLCAAGDQGHVHGSCHSTPFKVLLLSSIGKRALARVYSSETGTWGNIISASTSCQLHNGFSPPTLVGNSLYWPLFTPYSGILEFDQEEQSLAVIRGPPFTYDLRDSSLRITQVEDGVIGLAIVSYNFQLWQRNVNSHGVATWMLQKTIEMHSILGIHPDSEGWMGGRGTIVGYSEDTNVIFIDVARTRSIWMVQLKSMKSKRIDGLYKTPLSYHPFTSFHAPGATINGQSNGQNAP